MDYFGPSADAVNAYQGKDGNYLNKQDNLFKLFPFTTHKQCPEVNSGSFMKVASGCTIAEEQTPSSLFDSVVALIEGDLYGDSEDVTLEVLREIIAVSGAANSNNLRIALSSDSSNNADKIALYLSSMVGDSEQLKRITRDALNRTNDDANVVERLVYRVVPIIESDGGEAKRYFRVSEALSAVFLEDLSFILADPRLTEIHLSQLLSFYFFMTVSQNSLIANKRMSGSRDELEVLYFALEWEKTNQSRACYKQGFKSLESALEEMFVHAGVLELLNTVGESNTIDPIDYITLREIVDASPERELKIAENIREVNKLIRSYKYDTNLFDELPIGENPASSVKEEVDGLYGTVKSILFNTARNKPRGDYSNSFRLFSQSDMCFEKRRGRSGTLLNITDSALLLLTTLAIGEKDSISLTDLFKQFRRRGVSMDEPSREQVAAYFEKRSMLDKKSDSGETQYVKRVL